MKEKIDQQIKNGNIRFIGSKLPEDWYQGFREWKSEWEKNQSAEALYNMAYCYRKGEGTQLDPNKALELYEKAYALGVKNALKEIHPVMLDMCNYDGLSQDEALAKDNEFRQYYKRVVDAGFTVDECYFYLLDRAPIIRKYAPLAKAKDWDAFDRALANETDTSNEIISDLITARNLEVHFKSDFRVNTTSSSTNTIIDGSTQFVKSSHYTYKTSITIKNNSLEPVSARVRYSDCNHNSCAISGLKPSEIFSRSDNGYNRYSSNNESNGEATVYVLNKEYDNNTRLLSVMGLHRSISVKPKKITQDIKNPPSSAELRKRKIIAVLVVLFFMFLVYKFF